LEELLQPLPTIRTRPSHAGEGCRPAGCKAWGGARPAELQAAEPGTGEGATPCTQSPREPLSSLTIIGRGPRSL